MNCVYEWFESENNFKDNDFKKKKRFVDVNKVYYWEKCCFKLMKIFVKLFVVILFVFCVVVDVGYLMKDVYFLNLYSS